MSTDHEDFTKFAKFAVQQNGDALRHVPKRQGSCADHTSISTEAVQTDGDALCSTCPRTSRFSPALAR